MIDQQVVINPLEALALQGLKIEIDARTFLDYLHQDRVVTFEDGFYMGQHSRNMMSKRQTAEMMGVSERTVDNLRKRGELESAEYCGQVFFKPDTVKKYIQDHTNLYVRIHGNNNNKK